MKYRLDIPHAGDMLSFIQGPLNPRLSHHALHLIGQTFGGLGVLVVLLPSNWRSQGGQR